MFRRNTRVWSVGCLLMLMAVGSEGAAPPTASTVMPSWTWCGWGGGGFFYSAAFHPSKDGVIYMGGDVAGVYKTEDHGRNWRLINNGLADYGVFSLAVDRMNSQTVYAATEGGLCKSIDGGEHWKLLPHTSRKELRITGEKGKSIRCIAVDPTNSDVVFAASPAGKVYKSQDGGEAWNVSYERKFATSDPQALRVQFGKVDGQFYGGIWFPLTFPPEVKSEDCVGFGMSFKGDGTHPRDAFLSLKTAAGISYRSRNISDLFKETEWRDVVLRPGDFVIDPDYAAKHRETIATIPVAPVWSTVNRMDFSVVGSLPTEASVGLFGKICFAVTNGADGRKGTAEQPILLTVKEFSKSAPVPCYGNVRTGNPAGGTVYSVAVSEKNPALVIAATSDAGLVMSEDRGAIWTELKTPKEAASAAFDPSDPNVIYGAFHADGIWKSIDKGKTWASISKGLLKDNSVVELAVSPGNGQDIYAIGRTGWNGQIYLSHDGGATWKATSSFTPDLQGNPTLPAEKTPAISSPTNLAINPLNSKELFISANWRSCLSEDGGATWVERARGADISVVTDIRFLGARCYASAMDEGTLVSDNGGGDWRQLWPLKYTPGVSGHNWRLAISDHNGADHIVATVSPWDNSLPRIITSDDSGKTFKLCTEGLPDHVLRSNTAWGTGYPRALAADPKDPNILYLGIDGDPADGKSGGGIFKSVDGGTTWKQLAQQPASRRMFYGLAVDPTDSRRIYWGWRPVREEVYTAVKMPAKPGNACSATNSGFSIWRSRTMAPFIARVPTCGAAPIMEKPGSS